MNRSFDTRAAAITARHRVRFSLLAVAPFVMLPCQAAAVAAQEPVAFDDAWRTIAAEHRAAVDEAGIVGAALAFVHDGEIAAVDYVGMADLAKGRPVDERTIFHWASITKTFTAVALMQAGEAGLVRLDDPMVAHVPELRDVHQPYGSMEDVTIRHLLSHSAGFRNPTFPWDEGADWQPYEPTEWSQLVAMIPYTRLHFAPGSRYGYSNPGIIFGARALERVTGDPYEAYVDKNIFDALGMETAYFDATPWRLRPNRANNYRVIGGDPVAGGPEFDTGVTASNGGLNATVPDMARWIAFLSGAPAARRGVYDAVLGRTVLEQMWEPVVPVSDSTSALGPIEMGLSFFLSHANGRRLVGHTGSQKSFRAAILVDPEAGVGLIVVYNTAGGDRTAPDTNGLMEATVERAARELFALFRSD